MNSHWMIDMQINLLPWREEKKLIRLKKLSYFSKILLLVYVGLVSLASVYYYRNVLSVYADMRVIQSAIDTENSNYQDLQSKNASYISMRQNILRSYEYKETMNKLVSSMADLKRLSDRSISLTGIVIKNNSYILRGLSTSSSALTEYMKTLSSSPNFKNPQLLEVNSASVHDGSFVIQLTSE